jgi:predicted amidohydrolase YtcJ
MNGNEVVEAMLVDNGVIKEVGSTALLKTKIDNSVKVIDLNNNIVLPGFNDSHLHALMSATKLKQINLTNATSKEDAIRICKENMPSDLKENEWIIGYGWNQDYYDVKEFFTNKELDQISSTNPVCLIRACVHVCVVNSKALEIINVDYKDYLNDDDYNIGIDENNELNGFFGEKALSLVYDNFPKKSIEEIKELIIDYVKYLNSNGITSIQTDDFTALSNVSYLEVIQAYRELALENKLMVNVYQQCLFPEIAQFNEFINKGFKTGMSFNNYKIGPLKLLLDGSLGARSAAIRGGYADDKGNEGILIYNDEQLYEYGKLAQENNIQIAIHGIGDKAIEMIADMYLKLQEQYDTSNARHGIVHCQITDHQLIDKIVKAKSAIYAQPIFLHYDIHMVADRVGEKTAHTSYAFKTFKNKGLSVSFGTDSPVEDVNPFHNIYCAMTRDDLNGNSEPFIDKNECFTLQEALQAYNVEGAYQSFEEDIKGTIAINKTADFVVLKDDIFTMNPSDIKNVKVFQTYFHGNLVYESK